jgi:hypothetical protein
MDAILNYFYDFFIYIYIIGVVPKVLPWDFPVDAKFVLLTSHCCEPIVHGDIRH